MDRCVLCPRRCNVDRAAGERGACGVGMWPVVARAALHHWEEPCISGARGSGAIFFAGCALGCVYCQNYPISAANFGREVSPARLRAIMGELVLQGAHNINLVTPGHFVDAVLLALEEPLPVPVVWNSSGYELPEAIFRLRGAVQVFLPDWKYALPGPAKLYSNAADYPARVVDAIEAMIKVAGSPAFDRHGLMTGGVLVRHLVLPGHLDNSRAVIDGFAARFKGRAMFSLMGQYAPIAAAAKYPLIARKLARCEYLRVAEYLYNCGIDEGYVQDAGADDLAFTPPFDLTGVEEG